MMKAVVNQDIRRAALPPELPGLRSLPILSVLSAA